jgi:hypothetical protein
MTDPEADAIKSPFVRQPHYNDLENRIAKLESSVRGLLETGGYTERGGTSDKMRTARSEAIALLGSAPSDATQDREAKWSMEIEKTAFESKAPDRGFTVKASYLKQPNDGDALIEIFRDGTKVREFLFPAYKIWNIAAHFSDIVDGELENDVYCARCHCRIAVTTAGRPDDPRSVRVPCKEILQ